MIKKRLCITGISGLLGNNIAHVLKSDYEILGIFNEHPVVLAGVRCVQGDILDVLRLEEIFAGFVPHIVIHCASWTNVDRCEEEPDAAYQQNVVGTKNIVAAANGVGAKLVYISTDSVYAGVTGGYNEEDLPDPVNHYGVTKLAGEKEAEKGMESLILRTNIFGWNIQDKTSLGEWVISELSAGQKIKGFVDARFSGMYTMVLAELLKDVLVRNLSGIYNCASSTSMSKQEFAREIARQCGLSETLIESISVDEFSFTAQRGRDLSMSIDKLATAFQLEIPTLDESLRRFCQDLRIGIPEMIKVGFDILDRGIIPYGRQAIDDQDIQAVVAVLSSSHLTQGPRIVEFESALCERVGAGYAVAVNSGTSSLHIACLAAGVAPGDEVITSPITFVASANCAAYCGGRPVFADIDPYTYNISPEEIAKKITARTRAVIPVHFAGQSCDMEAIAGVVADAEKKYGRKIHIIEDACHALGSRCKGTEVGSCAWSDMVVMSFHPVKHVTTGEGGAVFTNDSGLARKLQFFRSHGITNLEEELNGDCAGQDQTFSGSQSAPWYYQQLELGYNYRITDIQCALGISQMAKLDAFRDRRRELVARYNEALAGLSYVRIPHENGICESNFHLYVLCFDFAALPGDRAALMTLLRSRGIQTQVHYIPVHTQPYFQNTFGTGWGDCPEAEKYYSQCLSLPLFPALSNEEQEYIIRTVITLQRKYVWN